METFVLLVNALTALIRLATELVKLKKKRPESEDAEH